MKHSQSLEEFPNLGKKSAQMLASADIRSPEQLRDLGPVVAFLAVRQTGQRPSLNLLWAIAAGLQDRHWTDLSDQEKDRLKQELTHLTR